MLRHKTKVSPRKSPPKKLREVADMSALRHSVMSLAISIAKNAEDANNNIFDPITGEKLPPRNLGESVVPSVFRKALPVLAATEK